MSSMCNWGLSATGFLGEMFECVSPEVATTCVDRACCLSQVTCPPSVSLGYNKALLGFLDFGQMGHH